MMNMRVCAVRSQNNIFCDLEGGFWVGRVMFCSISAEGPVVCVHLNEACEHGSRVLSRCW